MWAAGNSSADGSNISTTAAGRLQMKYEAQMMMTVLFMSDSCLLLRLNLSILGLSRVSLFVSSHMEMSSSDILLPGTDNELVNIGCWDTENKEAGEKEVNHEIFLCSYVFQRMMFPSSYSFFSLCLSNCFYSSETLMSDPTPCSLIVCTSWGSWHNRRWWWCRGDQDQMMRWTLCMIQERLYKFLRTRFKIISTLVSRVSSPDL